MLEVNEISIMIHTRYLVQSLSFTLNQKDKLAIIGEEGNGKSTLLKCLMKECSYAKVTGSIHSKGTIGYLEQSLAFKNPNQTVYDFLFQDDQEYYHYLYHLYSYLEQLKLQDDLFEQSMNTLSGGEKVKVQILKLLLEDYDILFLDEPTNDLDLETLEWLEHFLNQLDKPILFISHDETLLSNTANRILHIEQIKHKQECKHTLFNGDYQTYVEMRNQKLEKQTQMAVSEKREYQKKQEKLRKIMQKVEYQQNTITRADPHGAKVLKKKMHSLKSQEKKMNQMDLTEIPDVEEGIHFFFEKVNIPKNKVILKLDIPKLEASRLLSKNIHLEIIGNVHMCIIGKNGIGKTTLLKQIYETLNLRKDIQIGYMPQRYEDLLHLDQTVLAFCMETLPDEAKVRMYLGNMKFTKEEMLAKIGDLSNGTKAKLLLMKFVMDECNVLILDEPTRNVSPLSAPIIRKVLNDFEGTIISVSHDRKYIEEVADTVYELTPDGLVKV